MGDKTKFLQVRMTEEERSSLDTLAGEYGMDTSTFVRSIINYFQQERPNLVIIPEGKELAPA